MTPETIRNAVLLIFAVIAISLFISPFLVTYGSFTHLDGTTGVMDHWDLWKSTNPFTGSVYAMGDALCHQMESRSFMLNGSQLAFCVRDTSVIMGMLIGLTGTFFVSKDLIRRREAWYVAALLLLPTILEVLIQSLTDFDSLLVVGVTGTMMGLGVALVLWKLILKMFDDIIPERT